MNVFLIDTNFLWSLVDSSDRNHSIAVEWIKDKKLGEIFILGDIIIEIQNRYNREYIEIITKVIRKIEKMDKDIGHSELNVIIDKVAKEIKTKQTTTKLDKTKVELRRVELQDKSRKFFNSSESISKYDIKDKLLQLKDLRMSNFISNILMLKSLTYNEKDMRKESENKIVKKILEDNISFKDSIDGIIARNWLSIADNNQENSYEAISFDNRFSEELERVVKKLKIKNLKITKISGK